MEITPWFTRKFTLIADNGLFPGITERLAGSPMRLAQKLQGVSPILLSQKEGEKWSVQEEAGHILDLEPLWYSRFQDFQAAKEVLSEADLTNRKTFEAQHNDKDIQQILTAFAAARGQLMSLLAELQTSDLERSSLHPRMRTPMRPIDLAYFVAEHDDHHLATITQRLQTVS
ncbi:MAG: DinB family protein [Saprospiraceae bacterium]|nr:DinB family protein [Saprospiraceae bacterium]